MSVLRSARSTSTVGRLAPSTPGPDGPPGPGYVPPVIPAGSVGEEFTVAVADFSTGLMRGHLWGARFTYGRSTRGRGPGRLSIEVPINERTMRVLGEPTGRVDQWGNEVRRLDPIRWELLVGSTLEGTTDRYIVRDPVQRRGGVLQIDARSIEDLPRDRIVGAATRKNRIVPDIADFRTGLTGWTKVGDCEATVITGGPSGKRYVRITGTPGKAWLETTVLITDAKARRWGRKRIGGLVLPKLPSGDWNEYTLLSIGVQDQDTGQVWWPDPDEGDEGAGAATTDMPSGRWLADQRVEAFGYLPKSPFSVRVTLRLHALSTTHHVDYDAPAIIERENTTTETEVDLIRAVKKLWDHFDRGREQSRTGVQVVLGDPTGVEEVVTFWHEDHTSGPEALEAICGRADGPDYWFHGPARRIKTGRRRGAKRTDLGPLHTWHLAGPVEWTLDPGLIRSALQAISGGNTLWGGADTGVIDTSESDGQVIAATVSAPVGMNPNALDAWLRAELQRQKMLPITASLVLRHDVGRRISVGDSVRVAIELGDGLELAGWFRVTAWQHDPAAGTVTLDIGSDPELRGGVV